MPKQSPNLIPPVKKGVKPSASDTIDAKLTKGEAVLPAPVVKMLGKPFVKKLISLVPPDKGAKTVVKDGVLHAAGGADPDMLKKSFLEKAAAPNENSYAAAVGRKIDEYKGLPAVPAAGKFIADAGATLQQGAKDFANDIAAPNEAYKNFLYGEGNKTPAQQAFGAAAPINQPAATDAFNKAEAGAAADSILNKQGATSQSFMDRAAPAIQPAVTAPEQPAAGVQMDQSRYNKTGPMQPITTFNDGKGGSASVQFADGRTLNETQQDDLQKTIARNADPAVQAKFAEQAAISQGRYDKAKAFDDNKQQEQQKAMLEQQIQSAYNTLLQPQITGDLFGAINQKKQQAAASDFLKIATGNQQEQAKLQTNQAQFGVNQQLAADRLKFDKENAVATNAIAAQKQQDENDYKTAEQMKPTVVSKKRYNQDGIPIDEDQSVMQFDPRTKGFSVTPVKENETPESLFTQALKEASAEKDPRKRKYLIDYANQAYSSTLQTKAK